MKTHKVNLCEPEQADPPSGEGRPLFSETNANRYIQRVDSVASRAHGWAVRIRRNDFKTMKVFSDGIWGGAEQALAAAQLWRDKLVANPRWVHAVEAMKSDYQDGNEAGREGAPRVERYETHLSKTDEPQVSVFWMVTWIDAPGSA